MQKAWPGLHFCLWRMQGYRMFELSCATRRFGLRLGCEPSSAIRRFGHRLGGMIMKQMKWLIFQSNRVQLSMNICILVDLCFVYYFGQEALI